MLRIYLRRILEAVRKNFGGEDSDLMERASHSVLSDGDFLATLEEVAGETAIKVLYIFDKSGEITLGTDMKLRIRKALKRITK